MSRTARTRRLSPTAGVAAAALGLVLAVTGGVAAYDLARYVPAETSTTGTYLGAHLDILEALHGRTSSRVKLPDGTVTVVPGAGLGRPGNPVVLWRSTDPASDPADQRWITDRGAIPQVTDGRYAERTHPVAYRADRVLAATGGVLVLLGVVVCVVAGERERDDAGGDEHLLPVLLAAAHHPDPPAGRSPRPAAGERVPAPAATRTARQARHDAREDLRRRRDAALARHGDVTARWAAYETDLMGVFERPALADVRVPATAAFHRALAAAGSAAALCPPGADADAVGRYEKTVADLAAAWLAADQHAARVGQGQRGSSERRRMERAVGLLRQALDDAATDGERSSYLARAIREVEGLVVVPGPAAKTAARQIAAAGRRELTAGD